MNTLHSIVMDRDVYGISYNNANPKPDYYLGYKVDAYDENEDYLYSKNVVGVPPGSYSIFIGKSSNPYKNY